MGGNKTNSQPSKRQTIHTGEKFAIRPVHFVMNRVDNVLSRKLSNRAKLSGIPSE